jgi:hypothetical protein
MTSDMSHGSQPVEAGLYGGPIIDLIHSYSPRIGTEVLRGLHEIYFTRTSVATLVNPSIEASCRTLAASPSTAHSTYPRRHQISLAALLLPFFNRCMLS